MLIKDCCNLQEGYVNPSQEHSRFFNGNVKWLRANDLNNDFVYSTTRTLTEEGFQEAGKSALMFKPGTIAVSKSGTIGRIGFLKDYMCGNRAVINLEPDESKVDKMYLFYWLLSNRDLMEMKARGSIQKNLYVSALGSLDIGEATLEEQIEITQEINPIFSKMQTNNDLLRKLNEYMTLLYHQWFTDFNFPNAFNQPYRSSGGKVEIEHNLEIPIGWHMGTMSDLGDIVAGGTPSTDNTDYFCMTGIPWLTPKDMSITNDKYLRRGGIDLTEAGLKNSSASLLPKGTVLMSSRAPIGYLGIAMNEVTTNQGFKSVIPKDEIGSEFVYYTLQKMMPKIDKISSGSTFKEVSKEMFSKLKVIIPPRDLLDAYNQEIAPFLLKVQILEEQNKKLLEIRNLLISKHMSR